MKNYQCFEKPATGFPQKLIDKLSARLMTTGILWAAIAIFQILMGCWQGWWHWVIIGVLNIVSAATCITNSKRILTNPSGIVQAYEPIVAPLITLVYNLFMGGVIGVLCSVYYLIFVRGFIMENRSQFLAMETANPSTHNIPQNPNIVHVSITLTQYEADHGIQKIIYVAILHKSVRLSIPKSTKAGQTFALHGVTGTDQNGVTITKDVHITIYIQ